VAPNRRAQERERAAARAAAETKRAEAERKAIAEAEKDRPMIVALIFDSPFARLGRLMAKRPVTKTVNLMPSDFDYRSRLLPPAATLAL
jgi:hypothetical protein